jgi:AcrR family transcriptional regulator
MAVRPAVAPRGEPPTTRDIILDAGERCFAERGFAGVSMRAIAAEAGLRNQASLYHHFRDKQALYEAVLARGIGPIVALVAEGAATEAPTTADAVLERILDYLEAHPHLPRLIQRAGLDDARRLRGTLARLLRPLYAQGLQTLGGTTGGWAPDDLPHVAAGLYHLIFGYYANAALLELVTEQDPQSPTAVARQRAFLKAAVGQLLGRLPLARLPRPRARAHRQKD